MTHYIATLSTSGNGYVLRIPKRIVDESGLKPGDKIVGPELRSIPDTTPSEEKRQAVIDAFKELQRLVADDPSGIGSIQNSVVWQREVRQDRPLPGRAQS